MTMRRKIPSCLAWLCLVVTQSMAMPLQELERKDPDPTNDTTLTPRLPHPSRDHLLDPGFLTLPGMLEKVKAMGLIYEERPLYNISLKAENDGKEFFSCHQKFYETVVLERRPQIILHRRCDDKLTYGKCVMPNGEAHSLLCQEQFFYRKVKVNGIRMYQKVFNGCSCRASGIVSN